MRVKRGTLEAEREGGRLYVLLTPDPTTEPTDRTDELIAMLRDQLEAERQAHAEARRIIAGLVERIPPAIELPSQEARESPESSGPSDAGPDTPDAGGGPQTEAQRPWWRRMFGG